MINKQENNWTVAPDLTSSKTLLTKGKFLDADIIVQPPTLPGTATADEIIENKTAWVDGVQLTGTLYDYGADPLVNDYVIIDGDGGTNNWLRLALEEHNGIAAGKVTSGLSAPLSDFGMATAAQVLTGKTFTSAAGFQVTGTMPKYGPWKEAAQVKKGGSGGIDFYIPYGFYESGAASGQAGIWADGDKFGDVTADHVFSINTFTSKNNLKTQGTFKGGGFTAVARDITNYQAWGQSDTLKVFDTTAPVWCQIILFVNASGVTQKAYFQGRNNDSDSWTSINTVTRVGAASGNTPQQWWFQTTGYKQYRVVKDETSNSNATEFWHGMCWIGTTFLNS